MSKKQIKNSESNKVDNEKKDTVKDRVKDRVTEIADFYGFQRIDVPTITKEDISISKQFIECDYIDHSTTKNKESGFSLNIVEKTALLRNYFEKKMHELPQPVMLFYKANSDTDLKSAKKKALDGSHKKFCDLEIIGTSKSIAEAILIQTSCVILNEAGYRNLVLRINSIGDKESINNFSRDLTSFYRKAINDMDSESRQLFKKDPFELLASRRNECKELNLHAPKSITYLSDKSRTHFREVLEYLESLKICYNIDEQLLGNRKYCNEIIYEIVSYDEDEQNPLILAIGNRYDNLSKKLGYKKDIPSVGVSLFIKNDSVSNLLKPVKNSEKPSVFFIQLGFEAKLLSLKIMEMLRQVKISVHQSLSRDKLVSQITLAEKLNIPFAIIVGKKEAIDGTAIVRKMSDNSQQIIKIEEITTYIKNSLSKK